MRVRLVPKTAKAKQRIKAYGDEGEVLEIRHRIQARQSTGPWLLVAAADPTSRWVHQSGDPDFEVKEL